MKKIKKASELLWLLGVVFVAFGVAVCSKTNLGVSMIAAPAFVVSEAISSLWEGFTVGTVEYILQLILLIIMCVLVRKFSWKYLLAFAVAVLYGYTLDLFVFLLDGVTFDALWLRWIMLLVGDVITAFGVACFFRTYMPLQVYELFVAESAKSFKLKDHKVKLWFDVSLLVVSVVLALTLFGDVGEISFNMLATSSFHSIGLGTLVTTAINSPIIMLMGKLIDKAFDNTPGFASLEKLLGRE